MPRPFMVINQMGPAFDRNRPLQEQADWDGHAAFITGLASEGFVILAGVLEGAGEALLIVMAEDEAQVRRRLGEDPWVEPGLIRTTRVVPWNLGVGVLPPPAAGS